MTQKRTPNIRVVYEIVDRIREQAQEEKNIKILALVDSAYGPIFALYKELLYGDVPELPVVQPESPKKR